MKTGNQFAIRMTALAVAATLAACGGGGGGSPSSTVVVPPTPVLATLLMTAPPSGYADGSAEQKNVDALNRVRIAGGFGAFVYDAKLAQAASAHVAYLQADGLTSVGHTEVVGNPGFTGVDPSARCTAAGFGLCGEIAGATTSKLDLANFDAMGGYAAAIGHWQIALDYRNTKAGLKIGQAATGYNLAVGGDPWMYKDVMNLGQTTPTLPTEKANGIVGVFPFPDMTSMGIGLNVLGSIFGANIMIQMAGTANPVITSFTLRKDGATADTPAVMLQAGQPAYNGEPTQTGWALLVPSVLLDVNSRYTVNFAGTYQGNPVSKTWSFTTGASAKTKIVL